MRYGKATLKPKVGRGPPPLGVSAKKNAGRGSTPARAIGRRTRRSDSRLPVTGRRPGRQDVGQCWQRDDGPGDLSQRAQRPPKELDKLVKEMERLGKGDGCEDVRGRHPPARCPDAAVGKLVARVRGERETVGVAVQGVTGRRVGREWC